jgi:dipeptidyl aminopeptidase/acylaminoacyl peptidase
MTPETATAERERTDAEKTPGAGEPRPMREEDLLDFVWVTDPQISPDGTRVAFTRVDVDKEADDYRTSVWIVSATGGDARMLTSGNKDGQPRWSPDGTTLAFIRASGKKDEAPQLFVLPMDGGEAKALTTLAKGASSPAWSPDGKYLAFSSGTNPALDDPKQEKPKHEPARVVTRPMFRENNVGFYDFDHRGHVWVVNAAGGEPRQLTRGTFEDGPPTWSRDGKRILFVSDRRAEPWFGLDESKLWAVSPDLTEPTDGAALELVTDYPGPVMGFAEAADGRFATIGAIVETAHAYEQMTVLLHAGTWPMRRPKTVPATGAYAYGEGVMSDQHAPRGGGTVPLVFSPDGTKLYAFAAREGSSAIVRIDIATGAETELTPRGRDVVTASSTLDGRRWALIIGRLDRPGDVVVLDTADGSLRPVYQPNEELFERVALGSIEEFRYPSFDGQSIHGWIVRPPDYDATKRYPMVLQIHGGPAAAYGFGFFHEFQVLAGAGYIVVYTNPRGSTSYGWEFANIIQHRYPGDDAKDLLAAVDMAISKGGIDDQRLGVTGGSGGGLLTNWLITQTQRFAAAITQRCVSEWASMMYTCDFTMYLPHWFKKQPFQDPSEYAERSPATFVERVTTPLMVIHSEEDWRTPIAQGEVMFRALKYFKRPTVMVRFPGENHELSRSGLPSHRVQNQQHIRKWFDHWLQGKRTDEYGV